jgi:hypothetical protein
MILNPLSHLTPCTAIKSNLYFNSPYKTVISEPAQYRLHAFHIETLISIFRSLGRLSNEPIQA